MYTVSVLLCLLSECHSVHISGQHKGLVESLNFPNNYPANSHCSWTIQASRGNTINYTFTAFQLETSFSSCNHDYVKVHRSTPLLTFQIKLTLTPHPHSYITIGKICLPYIMTVTGINWSWCRRETQAHYVISFVYHDIITYCMSFIMLQVSKTKYSIITYTLFFWHCSEIGINFV